MELKEIHVKSCLTKSKITDYVINPYVGCVHGCKYCYATFIRKFQNIKENWGDFVYVKMNCPELLEKELEKAKPGNIWISSVTDCYAFPEGKYKMTRKVLEVIEKSKFKDKFTIEILTKSILVRRDFDLLKKLNSKIGCSVGFLDETASRIIEPRAALPKQRIETLKKAKEKGIKVYGFISPVLPGITNLEDLFRELNFCDYVMVELLNTKKYIYDNLMPTIKKHFPDKLKDFEFYQKHKEEYAEKIKKEVEGLAKKYGVNVKGVFVH